MELNNKTRDVNAQCFSCANSASHTDSLRWLCRRIVWRRLSLLFLFSFFFFTKLVIISYFVPVPKTLMDWFFEETGVKALASTLVNLNDSI